jgi:hypothetical protein
LISHLVAVQETSRTHDPLTQIGKNLVSQYLQVFARPKVLADDSPEPFVLRASDLSLTIAAEGDRIVQYLQNTGIFLPSLFEPTWAQLPR